MTTARCVHGIDRRFCAICNKASRGTRTSPAPTIDLAEILRFLNDSQTRATYGAVASLLGVPAQSIGAMLGTRRPEASWVVNAETGLPTGYEQTDWHSQLLVKSEIIRTANELTLRLTIWRSNRHATVDRVQT